MQADVEKRYVAVFTTSLFEGNLANRLQCSHRGLDIIPHLLHVDHQVTLNLLQIVQRLGKIFCTGTATGGRRASNVLYKARNTFLCSVASSGFVTATIYGTLRIRSSS